MTDNGEYKLNDDETIGNDRPKGMADKVEMQLHTMGIKYTGG